MITRSEHNEHFEAELLKLNSAQRSAVDTIEGPVLVVAGPGTGKTQILAARIGNILRRADTKPENVLCLTYTDAGAIAMRERLLRFIGPDAYRVSIYTFHAFCNTVIQDNLAAFGVRDLDVISELEEIEVYELLIDTFDKNHPLKRWTGDVYYERSRLKALFHLMKTEDWTATHIEQKANEYIADLPNREEYIYKRGNKKKGIQAGDPKQHKIDQEIGRMSQLVAASKEFPRFNEMMLERKRYDYDDMILWVLDEFKRNQNLLLDYQERYHYFLVDEYQDTNGAQNEILALLTDFWDLPNVFVVGDDDQSIYRFQGANVANILDFYKKYGQHLLPIVITDNYRSSQHILDISKALIDQNQERLINAIPGLSKDLKASNPAVANDTTLPSINCWYNIAHETVGIAKEIEKLHKKGVNLDEIAVIYRNHRQSDDIARYLQANGIPLKIKRKSNILDAPFIQKIITILAWLEGELRISHSREDLLFKILHFDFFEIDPLAIAGIAAELRQKRKTTWRHAVRYATRRMKPDLFDRDNPNFEKIKKTSDLLESWLRNVPNKTLQALLENIVTSGGILRYVTQSPESVWLMEELTTFFEFIKNESAKNPRLSLSQFLGLLQRMDKHDIALQINRTSFAEQGVNFVTTHSAKGLEFEYVFLIGCNAKEWDKPPRNYGYPMPDNLFTHLDKADDIEESRRLFYVALTRAKRHLSISFAKHNNEMKPLEKSRFIEEIQETTGTEIQERHLPDSDLLDYNMQVLHEEAAPEIQLFNKSYLRSLLVKYSLSLTHLNAYLRCPLSFYFEKLLRVPEAKNESIAFGTAVHDALERMFKKMVDEGANSFVPAAEFVLFFESAMQRQEDAFTDESFKRRMDYGREILPVYYNRYVDGWNRVVAIERNFRNVEVQGVPLNGKLDKIEFTGRDVNVVDYKTGRFDRARKKFAPPKPDVEPETATHEQQHGGDYWRQAVFYKILLDNNATTDWNVVSTEFDFIEPDPKTKEFHKQKVVISPEDVRLVTAQITDAWQRINNLEFNQGCGDENCRWCNFVKINYEAK